MTHGAYFADRYGITVVGAAQPEDFSEPSAKEVADLITQIQTEGIPAVFGSEVFSQRHYGDHRRRIRGHLHRRTERR